MIIGDAQRLLAKVSGPFDLIFQDGDKQMYGPMLDRLVDLLRPGGLLVTDNVLWDGDVVPGFGPPRHSDPADARAIAEYNELIQQPSVARHLHRAASRRRGHLGQALTAMTIDEFGRALRAGAITSEAGDRAMPREHRGAQSAT